MTPEPRQDRSGLRWIRSDLDQTLREARTALEDFVDGQAERIGVTIEQMHHVHGALEMVQVYGGAMLADEMEQLAVALSQGRVKATEAAAEALMLGIVQLPGYLEKIESGGADVPLLLLPLLNDIRAAHDAPLVSETSLFAPKLDAVIAAQTVRPGSGNRDLPDLIHHQRSHFHRALLHWIRGQDEHRALMQLHDVLDALNSAAGTARLRRLLDAAQALTLVLREDEEAPALAVKPLFGKLDRVFKQIIDQGEEVAMLDFPVELLKNLLYYVARSSSTDPGVVAVRQSAELANSFADNQVGGPSDLLGGPDRELFAAVGEALSQDLRDVKDRLDLFMRTDRGEFARVTGLATSIQRIGDTLGMVGRGELRTRLKHRCDELRAAEAAGQAPPDDRLMLLASDLLFVESSLSSLETGRAQDVDVDAPMQGVYAQSFSEGEMNLHFRAALDEAMVDIARTKDAILQYLDNPQANTAIGDVPQRLQAVAGALRVLELEQPAELLGALAPYFRTLADGERDVPSEAECDAIADVVIGAECYIQAAVESGEDRSRVLGYAQAALARLGVEPAAPGLVDASPAGMPPAEPVERADAPNVIAFPGSSAEPVPPAVDVAPPPAEAPAAETHVQASDAPASTAEPAAQATAADGFDGIDPEILEVFAEEAEEELQVIQTQYPAWRDDRSNEEALGTMRRSYHTLKGSGRLVGANNIGEFAWSIENLLNRVIDGTVADAPDVIQVLDDALAVLPALVVEAKVMTPVGTDVSALSARAFALAAGETPASVAQSQAPATPPDEAAPPMDVAEPPVAEDPEAVAVEPPAASVTDAALDAGGEEESILTASEAEDSVLTETEALTGSTGDTSLNAVFIDEANQHIAVLGGFLERRAADPEHTLFDDELRRAMHTLRGCSKTAGMDSLAEMAGTLEELGNVMVSLARPVDDTLDELLTSGHRTLVELAGSVEAPPVAPIEWQPTRDRLRVFIDDLSHRAPDLEEQHAVAAEAEPESLDPELLEVFLEEARELIESLETELADWQSAPGDLQPVAQLQRTLHTMKGGARLAGVTALGDLSHALESVFEGLTERRIGDSDDLQQLVRHATDAVAQYVEQLMQGQFPRPQPALNERLEAAARGETWAPIAPTDAMLGMAESAEKPSSPPVDGPGVDAADTAAVVDPDASPVDEPTVPEAPSVTQTGDEALAEIAAIGEPDDLESETEILTDSQLMTDSELLRDSSYLSGDSPSVDSRFSDLVADDSTVVHFPASEHLDEGEGFVPRRPLPAEERVMGGSGERVRVPSEALDQMVNNAGEVSIYRARIEQQNTTFAFNLGELRQTIDRLRSQLRALELETEAQVLSRHERERESDSRADFDPLELDRYSTMQQLSRALSETVEDLSNLGNSLTELSRDTDTLLLQQARVNTDLQDSLLRTRMVKFASRVPRLERVVRQTAHGLEKQAALKVSGGHEDMDRAILERMMSPLEHLLRNAVSHGIEDSNTRLANGKPEEGSISLQLAREGSDVVLTLADDGAGLDRARIRAKAVERGLIDADAVVDDDQLYQLILQPGFSTAEELSQVSGRGVGMDVALTEVKQLGGTLDIASEPGRGTRFTIRLPFTLAITDSLLVTLGEDIYAVPHSSMDGVVRVPVDDLRAIYAGEREVFSYGHRDYAVRYLGTMLGTQAPSLPDGVRWLPVLLVRSGEHRVAIQVDGLLGNRQVVVKSVGAQLSSVRWFTGGTILADGQIALILDINSLVRRDLTQVAQLVQPDATPAAKGVSVMVVDDSITVRKVTSRLLERHNMQVFTAKDGVDAVTQLQEQRPDVMLLDIEMPRMDGYELARHMRSTPELSDIPIIMITSRSGEKHRDRAFELGVKRYLGKPYQEGDLLENIYTVLAESSL